MTYLLSQCSCKVARLTQITVNYDMALWKDIRSCLSYQHTLFKTDIIR